MSHVPMTLPELAIANYTRPFSHTCTYVELDDGRILHCSKRAIDYSSDGGLTWSETKLMVDVNGDPVGAQETSLVKLAGRNEVGLAARVNLSVSERPANVKHAIPHRMGKFVFWRSKDGGATWQPPIDITPPYLPTAGYQDCFCRTSSGRILLPVFFMFGQHSGPDDRSLPITGRLVRNQWVSTAGHYFDPTFSCNYVVYSDDNGETWHMNKDGGIIIMLDWNAHFSISNEATMTEVAPGRLLMFMRNGLGRLFQAWSNDNGETWTRPQPTVLASPTAPAQIRTLPNGHLLCVWNQASEEEIRAGVNRTRISSAISRDGGRVWEFFQNVESMYETTRVEPGPIRPVRPEEGYFPSGQPAAVRDGTFIQQNDDFGNWCYPSVLVMKDRVLIAHTYTRYVDHPTEARLVADESVGYIDRPSGKYICQKIKILPLKWFYGGKEPADNPFLRTAYEPAKP